MHVISRRKLNEFAERYPETKSALKEWYQKMKTGQFQSIAALRTIFPSADKVGKMTVFNIGGNKIRLIAAIHYNRQKFYIREVLTHAEYEKNKWKEQKKADDRYRENTASLDKLKANILYSSQRIRI